MAAGHSPKNLYHSTLSMDILESLFSTPHSLSQISDENRDDFDTSSTPAEDDDDTMNATVASDDEMKIDFATLLAAASSSSAITPTTSSTTSSTGRFPVTTIAESIAPLRKIPSSRPERGKFTILDGIDVARVDDILEVDFNPELLQSIFVDPKIGIQFLARYGLIPNTRVCRVENCPKDQLMSLIKHANGFVWRCRSCRKRREKRIITKISVYEGTFLFYSRMPLNKFFIFMYVWCEYPGLTITEYNKLMGENRLVEETIYNTIGFIRDIIQNWCESIASSSTPIGGEGKRVEIIETMSTEQLSNKSRNRRTRHFITRTCLICLDDNAIAHVDYGISNKAQLFETVREKVAPGSLLIMRDVLMSRFGTPEELNDDDYKFQTIADTWLQFDEQERDAQFIKTLMNNVPNAFQEPYAYEYYFRRCFQHLCFNNLLKVIRLLYNKS